ncbi:MAG: magnesium transporter, partial [Ureaplasma sp.]|nr:magnesium transporter [Ureaplasma sp.]
IKDCNEDWLKRKIIISLNSQTRQQIKEISSFEEEEAGSIMNPEFFNLNSEWTISKCISEYRKNYNEFEKNTTFYVTSSNNKLLGNVSLQELIFCEDQTKQVQSIMNEDILFVNPEDSTEKIVDIFQDYSVNTLAVVNNEQILVGVINYNDILPALEDEVTEDIYNMYGITELKNSYMKSSIWSIVKSRIFWLVILMVSATLTSFVIEQFQDWGDKVTQIATSSSLSSILLIPILPVITGTSGNAGSQSVASVVRSLSIGEVTKKEYRKVIFKEFLVGVVTGGLLMIINFIRLLIFFAIPGVGDIYQKFNPPFENPYSICAIIAGATSVALWLAIILSKTLGAVLPLLATKLGKDPTVMSAPLIATLLDVSSTALLFSIGIGSLLPIMQFVIK